MSSNDFGEYSSVGERIQLQDMMTLLNPSNSSELPLIPDTAQYPNHGKQTYEPVFIGDYDKFKGSS